jgi:hypothetical protein
MGQGRTKQGVVAVANLGETMLERQLECDRLAHKHVARGPVLIALVMVDIAVFRMIAAAGFGDVRFQQKHRHSRHQRA